MWASDNYHLMLFRHAGIHIIEQNFPSAKAMANTGGKPSEPPGLPAANNAANDRQTRDQRDILRFMYQTQAKGQGKGYQDWLNSWRQCRTNSVNITANSAEGALDLLIFCPFFCFVSFFILVCSASNNVNASSKASSNRTAALVSGAGSMPMWSNSGLGPLWSRL